MPHGLVWGLWGAIVAWEGRGGKWEVTGGGGPGTTCLPVGLCAVWTCSVCPSRRGRSVLH